MKIVPQCRYSHGPLESVDDLDGTHLWSLTGIKIVRARAGQVSAGDPLTAFDDSGRAFTVRTYRCSQCGYVEMFDDRVANG